VSTVPSIPHNHFGDNAFRQLATIYNRAWRMAQDAADEAVDPEKRQWRRLNEYRLDIVCAFLEEHPSYLGPWTGIEHGHTCRACGKINGPTIEGYCINDSQLDHRDFLDLVRELGGGE